MKREKVFVVRAILKKEYTIWSDDLEEACDKAFDEAWNVLPEGYEVDAVEVVYE